METKKRLSQKEAIAYLDCSRKHLHNLALAGKLKPKYLGRKPYYLVDEIDAAMTDEPETFDYIKLRGRGNV